MGQFLFSIFFLLTVNAFADTATKTTTPPSASEPPPDLIVRPLAEPPSVHAAKSTSSHVSSDVVTARSKLVPEWRFSAGPGMVVYGGNLAQTTGNGSVGYALNFGALTHLSEYDSILVGVDLGINSWSFDTGFTSSNTSATGIQMLATCVYQFPSVFLNELRPYAGISAGPYVYIAKIPTSNDSTLYLEALIRPGLLYQASNDLAFGLETKFGILGTDFVFAPQLNVNLSL